MRAWKSIKNADGKGGIRYREHATRKHGAVPDRYYSMTYWWQGKAVSEGIGWASEGWTPTKCFNLLADIKKNQATGKGPCTLSEVREEAGIEKEARRKKAAAEESLNISFKLFFNDVFLPDAKSRWTPETTRKAVEHVHKWIDPVTGGLPFRELGLKHINRIRANLADAGRAPRTQQYVARTFAMVWRSAKDHGLVDTDCPTKSGSFRLPKVDNERQRYLSVDEETALLEAVKRRSHQAHDMAVVALDAALRFGEVATLSWQCVDLEYGALRILDTKGGRDRSVPMTERLKALFASMDRGKKGHLVFPAASGTVHLQVPSAFKRGLVDAKLNEGVVNPKLRASFHTLRHTAASRLVQSGVDLYRVQRILGHSTPAMTARYSHLAGDNLAEAIQRMEQARSKKGAKVIPFRKAANNPAA